MGFLERLPSGVDLAKKSYRTCPYYRFGSTRFNCNCKNRFLAVFLVVRVKKLVFFNCIVFADMSLVRRSLFARYTPYYKSYNSDSKNKRFRVFTFSLILTRITSSYTP